MLEMESKLLYIRELIYSTAKLLRRKSDRRAVAPSYDYMRKCQNLYTWLLYNVSPFSVEMLFDARMTIKNNKSVYLKDFLYCRNSWFSVSFS
jgi:hypothetical protein